MKRHKSLREKAFSNIIQNSIFRLNRGTFTNLENDAGNLEIREKEIIQNGVEYQLINNDNQLMNYDDQPNYNLNKYIRKNRILSTKSETIFDNESAKRKSGNKGNMDNFRLKDKLKEINRENKVLLFKTNYQQFQPNLSQAKVKNRCTTLFINYHIQLQIVCKLVIQGDPINMRMNRQL